MKREREGLSANGKDTVENQLDLLKKATNKSLPKDEESLSDAISRIRQEKKKGS